METLHLLSAILGFLIVIGVFFFGGFVLLDSIFSNLAAGNGRRVRRVILLTGMILVLVVASFVRPSLMIAAMVTAAKVLYASLVEMIHLYAIHYLVILEVISFIKSSNNTDTIITFFGVLVALVIGGMQVFVAYQQKNIAEQQASISERQGEIQSISSWLPFLDNDDSNVRFLAVTSLERIGMEATLAPLAMALSDRQEVIRNRAADALSKLATPRTIDVVVQILGNQDQRTRNAAIATLSRVEYEYVPEIKRALARATPAIRIIGQEVVGGTLLHRQALEKIGVLESHDLTMGNPEIVVAVIGSSVDQSVLDIRNALVEEVNHVPPEQEVDDTQGYDLSTTMAARLIVGSPRSDIVGIAPGVKLISERVVNGRGVGTVFQVVKGFEHALKNRARVIYFGLGGVGEYAAMFEYMMSRVLLIGCLPIAAAGSSNNEEKVYPAAVNGVMAVSATDADDIKANYSSYGEWVDISAPGNPIVSGDESGNAEVHEFPGTNFAAAIVAGAAALVLSVNPSLSVGELNQILLSTADNIDDINPAFRQKLGAGRVNVLRAVHKAVRSLQDPSP